MLSTSEGAKPLGVNSVRKRSQGTRDLREKGEEGMGKIPETFEAFRSL